MAMQQSHGIRRAEFVDTGDGKRAFYAAPDGEGTVPGVLVFQEAFGVNDYIQGEAKQLAAHGYAAIAPDLFNGKTVAYDDLDRAFGMLKALTDEGMLDHTRAAMRFLDAQPEVRRERKGAVGFCMGGRLAFLIAVSEPDQIAAASSFYGGGIAAEQKRFFDPLLDRVPELRGALLLIYGADDESITPQEHARLTAALSTHKKRYCISVFPGAPHGFASRHRTAVYRPDAAEEAWAETLALFDRRLR
jgi:carboxymethylenebutenolidase